MSEMVERVARAICRGRGHDPDRCVLGSGSTLPPFSTCYRRAWEDEIDAARAAIEAMREPTLEMIRAARRYGGSDYARLWVERASRNPDDDGADIYVAMIDSALTPSPAAASSPAVADTAAPGRTPSPPR
jgi:hypothetical protein